MTTPAPARAPRSPHPADRTETGTGAWLRRAAADPTSGIFAVLILLVVVFSVLRPGSFPTLGNLQNVVSDAAILLVLAVGSTFVIVTGGIDLSVGGVLVFSAVAAAEVMNALGGEGFWAIAAGLLAALAAGTGWGLVNGFLVARARIPALIVTLGTMGAATGAALLITGGVDVRDVPLGLVLSLGSGRVGGVPWLIVVAVVLAVVFGVLLAKTRFGRYTYAVGSNAEALRRSGVRTAGHLVKVYAIGGLLAGVAGYLTLARFATTTLGGHTTDNLQTIAAVVIGGTSLFGGRGTMFGTVVGVFIPTVLQNGFVVLGISAFWQQVAVGAVLIAAVYLDQLPSSQQAEIVTARSRPYRSILDRGVIMNRSRILPAAAAAAAVLIAASACGSSTGGGGSGGKGGSIMGKSVAFVPGVSGDSFYITMGCGIKAQAAKYGLKINEQAPQKFDPSQQTPIVNGVVAKRPVGLLIAPTDAKAMIPPLLQAKQAGIKVGLVDTTLTKSGIASFGISTDNRQAGATAADTLAKLVGDKGKVLVIAFKAGVSTSDDRQNGFLQGIKKYKNITALKPQVNDNDPAKAASIVSATLAANPDLAGVFATNQFAAEGAATGLRNAGKQGKVKVVGFDAGPVQIKQLQRGDVQALVAQRPYSIGTTAIDDMADLLRGKKPPQHTGSSTIAITAKDLKTGAGKAAAYKTEC